VRVRALRATEEITQPLEKERTRLEETQTKALTLVAQSNHKALPQEDRTALANISAAGANFGQARIRQELEKRMDLLLDIHPLWTITNQSVGSTLPDIPGAFDLLVIDEASQCDIATTVPLLFRCRRVAVVGDPMQLKHISNIKQSRDESLLRHHGLTALDVQRLSFRENSLYQVVASTPNAPMPTLLSTHYRCHPAMAGLVSKAFYRDKLHIATDGRAWMTPKGVEAGTHWTDVKGPIELPGKGAYSPAEIDAVLAELKGLQDTNYEGSIGVVTPFRKQCDRIRDRIHQELKPAFIERARLEVGTAHTYQGDERDVMLFSLCVNADLGFRVNFATDTNLFNVAISRARAVLHVIGDLNWALHGDGVPSHVRELARSSNTPAPPTSPRVELYESPWERRLDEALSAAGIDTIPQYRVAGRRLDFAVIRPNIKLDVEVDGETWHKTASGHRKDDDLWRDHQLTSLGWKVCRFWVYQLREDMDGCVAKVRATLDAGESHD
jgi:very-short-patch-repair endonuclease